MKKPKKETLTKKKAKLWHLVSLYIRNRDGWRCFTCGRYATGSALHAGHFIPSSVGGFALRYDETNIHAQCYHCNINLSGNWVAYRENMIALYGEEYVKSLEKKRHDVTPDFDYDAKIEEYKAKCHAIGLV